MNNQTQYDELWNEHTKYKKIVEIMKNSGFKSGKMTTDEIYKEMCFVTLLDVAENLNELCTLFSDIMEVIENDI